MKNIILIILIILTMLISCNKKAENSNRPLETIIKLNSAEEIKNYDEAVKYIDVDKVYSRCLVDGIKPYDCWVQYVDFSYNFSKEDKKFTNRFGYYKYDIKESINGNKSTVEFISMSQKKKEIIYSLELINTKWIVVKIDYLK
jgi:hypothetical protein